MVVFSRCQNNAGDGCGCSFPQKDSAGLCNKCYMPSTLIPGTDEYVGMKVSLNLWIPLQTCNDSLFLVVSTVQRLQWNMEEL
jgi:hypothetical protein